MSKFSKHIGEGEKLVIGDDTFILKPLGIEHSGHFLNISKGFSGAKTIKDEHGNDLLDEDGNKKVDMEGLYKNFTDDTMDSIKTVVIDTLTTSYPDEDVAELKVFAGKYLMKLLPLITKMNSEGSVDKDSRAQKKIDEMIRIRAKQNESIQSNKE